MREGAGAGAQDKGILILYQISSSDPTSRIFFARLGAQFAILSRGRTCRGGVWRKRPLVGARTLKGPATLTKPACAGYIHVSGDALRCASGYQLLMTTPEEEGSAIGFWVDSSRSSCLPLLRKDDPPIKRNTTGSRPVRSTYL